MFVTIISDCHDDNARMRQITRAGALLPNCGPVSFSGITDDREAAGHLVDALDASLGTKGVILVNVAPRSGEAKRFSNGTPFGYWHLDQTLVISSVDGFALSLAKKLGLVSDVKLMDIATVAKELDWAPDVCDLVTRTQFRSYEFLPRVARAILAEQSFATEAFDLAEVPIFPGSVWMVDGFGNVKTSMLAEDTPGFTPGSTIQTTWGRLSCFWRLSEVPSGQSAIIEGSSGFSNRRFLELVVQGGKAAKKHDVTLGQLFHP